MPITLLIKLIAGLFSIWLVLIWSDNLPHPTWLKDDTESLLAIPAALLWIMGFWEEVENFFRKKFSTDTPPPAPPVQVTVQNILPPSPTPTPPHPETANDPVTQDASPHRYDTSNRLVVGPDDPILDPLLGKPLHGRAQEIKDLAALLDHSQADVQVVHTLVLAPGGVGKTELCKAALREYLRTHPYKQVWFVSLEAASVLSDLWQRMASAIGLDNPRSEAELLAALPEGLYYLDNLESLSAVPHLAQHLRRISQKPGVRLLASSRYEVPGWGKTFDLHTLPPAAATALFREVWADSDAAPLPADAPELETFVCEQLGCLPLAVVLIAALGRYEGSLAAVMQRWHSEGTAAAQRPGAAPDDRLDSLTHSMRLSLARLGPPARLLWGLAAFFPDGLPQDYFEWILLQKPTWKERLLCWLSPSRYPKPHFREGRDQLLLHRILHWQGDRLQISPPLARFARDLSTAAEAGFEPAALFRYLAPWLQAMGHAAERDREGRVIARLLEEFSTLEAVALFFTAQPALPEGLMPLLRAWQNFYSRRIFLGKKILDAARLCTPKLPDGDHAWVLKFSGNLALQLGENAEARSRYDAALPLYKKVGDDVGKANTLKSLGDLAYIVGENAEARSRYDAALPLFEEVGSDLGKANTLKSLGDLALDLGENTEARARYDAALPLYEKVGDDLGKANTLKSLGDLARLLGENAEARSRYDAALPLYEKVGSDVGKANTLKSLGDLAYMMGENAEARSRYDAALPLYEKVGSDLGKANTLTSLGDLALDLGENTEARERYDAALPLYEKVGSDLGKANTLTSLGDLALDLGENTEARERYDAALPLYEKVGSDLGKANTLRWLGYLEKTENNTAAAQAHFAAALALYQKVGEPMGQGYCHVELARTSSGAVAQEHLRLAQACSEKVGEPVLARRVQALEQDLNS